MPESSHDADSSTWAHKLITRLTGKSGTREAYGLSSSEFSVHMQQQKTDQDCAQTCLDMLGYPGHTMFPAPAMSHQDVLSVPGFYLVAVNPTPSDEQNLDFERYPHMEGFEIPDENGKPVFHVVVRHGDKIYCPKLGPHIGEISSAAYPTLFRNGAILRAIYVTPFNGQTVDQAYIQQHAITPQDKTEAILSQADQQLRKSTTSASVFDEIIRVGGRVVDSDPDVPLDESHALVPTELPRIMSKYRIIRTTSDRNPELKHIELYYIVDGNGNIVSPGYSSITPFLAADGMPLGIVARFGSMYYILQPPTQDNPEFHQVTQGYHSIQFRPNLGGRVVGSIGSIAVLLDENGLPISKEYTTGDGIEAAIIMHNGKLYGNVSNIVRAEGIKINGIKYEEIILPKTPLIDATGKKEIGHPQQE